ncbi:MAG: hypothetical protein RRY12_01420 [Cloacibacillus sp.]
MAGKSYIYAPQGYQYTLYVAPHKTVNGEAYSTKFRDRRGTQHSMLKKELPFRSTAAEAQADLDAYAAECSLKEAV